MTLWKESRQYCSLSSGSVRRRYCTQMTQGMDIRELAMATWRTQSNGNSVAAGVHSLAIIKGALAVQLRRGGCRKYGIPMRCFCRPGHDFRFSQSSKRPGFATIQSFLILFLGH